VPMIQCDTVQEMLTNYVDNTIEPSLKSQIQAHLDACPGCKKIVANVQLITSRLQKFSSLKTSSDFDQKLRTKILSENKAEKPVIPMRNLSYGLSGVAIVACVYFVSTADFFWGSDSDAQPMNSPTMSNTQPSGIPNQQIPTTIQPVDNAGDAIAADTARVDEHDIQLIDNE